MSYDVRDFAKDLALSVRPGEHWRFRCALDEAAYYLRTTDRRCIVGLHKFESYYRPNYYRDDMEDGFECVYCGKEPADDWLPLRWRFDGWFYGTRLGGAISDWLYRRYAKKHPETEVPF